MFGKAGNSATVGSSFPHGLRNVLGVLLCAFVAVLLASAALPGKAAYATTSYDAVNTVSGSGYAIVGAEGTYVTQMQKAVDRINEIRKEACDEGINGLTSSDYVPIQWSYDMEQIARVRSAEASTGITHTRPNGTSCFTVEADSGETSHGEVLAWNWSGGVMQGIEQWYEEKEDLLNNTGNETGHYEIMINQDYTGFAVVGFNSEDGIYPWSVCGEFWDPWCGSASSTATNIAASEDVVQYMQVKASELYDASITGVSSTMLVGDTAQLGLQATLVRSGTANGEETGPYSVKPSSVTWTSSSSAIGTVSDGLLSAKAIGSTVVTASADGGLSATATVQVKGDASNFTVSPIAAQTYTGSAIMPSPTVKYGSTTLKKGTDYTLSYSNNVNAGTATVTVTGAGNYTGTVTATFTISRAKVSAPTVNSGLVYTGEEQTGVASGTGYALSGTAKATNAGSYTAKATLDSNYAWSDGTTSAKNISWSIGKASIASASVGAIASQTYTGSALTPKPTVTLNGKTLALGTDYTVAYSNNTNAGTATVTVTGAGNYTGSCSTTFDIVKVETQDMYRLYNPNSGEHFYTAEAKERDNLIAAGWNYEGIGWTAPVTSSTPVYRMYNPNPGPNGSGEHHYTMKADERDMLIEAGWTYEGVGWYSDDEESVVLYREYNPNAYNCNHNYTTSKEEHNKLVALGWEDEGTAWYGVSMSS